MSNSPVSVSAFTQQVMPLLHRTINAQRIIEAIGQIIATDRWNSFDQWHETTRTMVRRLEAGGAATEVYSAPTGGRTGDGRWIIHEAGDVYGGTLDIVEPIAQRLADWNENPWHVAQWSALTPREGVVCPLVAIDDTERLARVKPGALRGKMVLTRLSAWDYRAQFAEKGAYGIINDAGVKDCPDAVAWMKFGWGGLDLKTNLGRIVGISLSYNQGQALRKLIDQHRQLKVRVMVDGRRYAGTHDVVSGIVRGQDDPVSEIWAVAHTCEPGALDNASGVAACIEVAQVLNELIASGRIRPPRRSIRLVLAYECYGFFHYLEHHPRFQTPLAGLCVDTVGARPDICDSHLRLHGTVPSSATFVDDLGARMIRSAMAIDPAGYHFEEKPFTSTEDTLLGDPKYGFPCPWITNHPWRGYHSSADTLDLVHPPGLVTCTAAVAGYLYYLANMATPETLELADHQTQKTVAYLSENAGKLSRRQVDYALEEHATNLQRLQRWLWGGQRTSILQQLAEMEHRVRDAAGRAKSVAVVPAAAGSASSDAPPVTKEDLELVPMRLVPLAPTGENLFPPLCDLVGLRWAVYWADGQRTLGEIADLTAEEPCRPKPIPLARIVKFFKALAEIGWIGLSAPDELITEQQLIEDLRRFGVRPGMDLVVHSSLSRIGQVRGGAAAVVQSLVNAVGPAGTVLFPSFNHFAAGVFNPLSTPTSNGAIPDAAWRRPDAIRSIQGSHSVCAIGPKATFYTAGHLEAGIWGQDSPLGRLVHHGGYILGLGVTAGRCTVSHVAEVSMPAPCLDEFGSIDRIVLEDGSVREVPGLSWRAGGCPVDMDRKMDEAMDQRGVVSRGKIGRADSFLVRALDLWTLRREHLEGVCQCCPVRPKHRR